MWNISQLQTQLLAVCDVKCDAVIITALQRNLLSANPCQRWLPVWHHHILLITAFFLSLFSFSPPPRYGSRCVIPGEEWQDLSQVPPILSSHLFAHWEKTDEPRWRWGEKKEESVRTVSVSDNCLGQQKRVGMKVSAKAIGVTAPVVCYFQGYDISHCSCTKR